MRILLVLCTLVLLGACQGASGGSQVRSIDVRGGSFLVQFLDPDAAVSVSAGSVQRDLLPQGLATERLDVVPPAVLSYKDTRIEILPGDVLAVRAPHIQETTEGARAGTVRVDREGGVTAVVERLP